MKGISYCDECANYDWENERCNKGASIEDDYGRIYKDCPLPDAEPVRHGKWYTAEKYNGYLYWNCDQCHKHFTSQKSNYCPNCGAKMIDGMDGD